MSRSGIAIILQNVLLEEFSADSQGIDAGPIELDSIRVSDQLSIGWFPLLTFLVSIALLGGLQLLTSRRGSAGRCGQLPTTHEPPS